MTIPANHQKVSVGVIGGSGLYHLDELELEGEYDIMTPWGKPSDKIRVCVDSKNGARVAFLSRHGRGHALNPSEVNHRANIAALKHLGVELILAFSAVGSLREEIAPMDFVLPSQCVDRTKGNRKSTYFENGLVAHVQFGHPFNEEIRDIVYRHGMEVFNAVNTVGTGPKIHRDKTLVVMEGPAFSTKAESEMYRSVFGCDIINMSTLPEAKLAREAEIDYQVVCMATDYDCWREGEEEVSVEAVIGYLRKNTENAKKLLLSVLPELEKGLTGSKDGKKGGYKGSVQKGTIGYCIITSKDKRNPEQVEALRFMFPDL